LFDAQFRILVKGCSSRILEHDLFLLRQAGERNNLGLSAVWGSVSSYGGNSSSRSFAKKRPCSTPKGSKTYLKSWCVQLSARGTPLEPYAISWSSGGVALLPVSPITGQHLVNRIPADAQDLDSFGLVSADQIQVT
jgi:hypothetical protein